MVQLSHRDPSNASKIWGSSGASLEWQEIQHALFPGGSQSRGLHMHELLVQAMVKKEQAFIGYGTSSSSIPTHAILNFYSCRPAFSSPYLRYLHSLTCLCHSSRTQLLSHHTPRHTLQAFHLSRALFLPSRL